MKKPQKRRGPTKPKATVDPSCNEVGSGQSRPGHREEVVESDRGLREALSRHLHDLLNSLWPAAVRIELAISEKTCSPEFRKTLQQVGRNVEEAMSLAVQASALVDSPSGIRTPP